MASAAAILTQSEKNRGAIVIDIGSNITSFSIYVDGSIFHNGILDFGGDNINEIIAQSFAIDVMSAEYLKINYGKLEANISEKDKLISLEIKIQGKIVIKYLSSMDLYEALGDAYDSLLEKIKKEIFSIKNFKFQKIKSGIYLTGGGSNIFGIEAKTRRLLNVNVKKGSVNRDFINGEEKILADPEYSASLGLFNLWLQKQQVPTEESVTQKSDIGSKIGAWLKNF
jgi:cell division protein FtsA